MSNELTTTAIVITSFGPIKDCTIYHDLRRLVTEQFPRTIIRMAFTSKTMLKKFRQQSVQKSAAQSAMETGYSGSEPLCAKNLQQVLADLDSEGIKKIIVASIYLYPTEEHQKILKIVNCFSQISSAEIKVTDAILSKAESAHEIISGLMDHIRNFCPQDNSVNLFISHGTSSLENAGIHSIFYFNNILEKIGNFTCSLEGCNAFKIVKDHLIAEIKKQQITHINMVPLLLFSASHYQEDILEIKAELEKHFKVNIISPIPVASNSLATTPMLSNSTNKASDRFYLLSLPAVQNIITTNIKEKYS